MLTEGPLNFGAVINSTVSLAADASLVSDPPQGYSSAQDLKAVDGSWKWETLPWDGASLLN